MLPWRACCRQFVRRLDWISCWWPRDALHPVRPESKGKVRPRAKQQLRPRVKWKVSFLMRNFQLLVVVFQLLIMAFRFLMRSLQLLLTIFLPAGDCPRSLAVCPGFAQLVPQPM